MNLRVPQAMELVYLYSPETGLFSAVFNNDLSRQREFISWYDVLNPTVTQLWFIWSKSTYHLSCLFIKYVWFLCFGMFVDFILIQCILLVWCRGFPHLCSHVNCISNSEIENAISHETNSLIIRYTTVENSCLHNPKFLQFQINRKWNYRNLRFFLFLYVGVIYMGIKYCS